MPLAPSRAPPSPSASAVDSSASFEPLPFLDLDRTERAATSFGEAPPLPLPLPFAAGGRNALGPNLRMKLSGALASHTRHVGRDAKLHASPHLHPLVRLANEASAVAVGILLARRHRVGQALRGVVCLQPLPGRVDRGEDSVGRALTPRAAVPGGLLRIRCAGVRPPRVS